MVMRKKRGATTPLLLFVNSPLPRQGPASRAMADETPYAVQNRFEGVVPAANASPTSSFASPDEAIKHYQQLCDSLQAQLADANSDIHEFTESSRDLQEELEKELARMEASEKSMRKGLDEARGEMEDWKVRPVLLRAWEDTRS